MKKILVPTDFSENASNAVEYAAQIGLSLSYKILLLHVAGQNDEISEKEEKLRIICRALNESFPDLECTYRMVKGDDIPREIVASSKLFNAEMIVMGTKGVSNFESMLFGTNTAAVIEKASCTVLSVPGKKAYVKPKNILFATNFEKDDVRTSLHIIKIAKPFGANVTIAHVLTDLDKENEERTKMQMFAREVSMLSDYPRITFKLSTENTVAMGLDSLIESTRANVIAMRTHRRGLMEKLINPSITRKYAEESIIPLLAFH